MYPFQPFQGPRSDKLSFLYESHLKCSSGKISPIKRGTRLLFRLHKDNLYFISSLDSNSTLRCGHTYRFSTLKLYTRYRKNSRIFITYLSILYFYNFTFPDSLEEEIRITISNHSSSNKWTLLNPHRKGFPFSTEFTHGLSRKVFVPRHRHV